MAINSFTTLKSAVADWLDRDDMGDAIETMIGLAEARIYRELRIRPMETSLSVTIASGVAAVPSDYLELRHAYVDQAKAVKLEPRSLEWIVTNYPTRSASSIPKYIARDGDDFHFGPYPDSTYTIKGVYYAKLTALGTANETNWFTSNAPDLLLYGTLVHTAPYIGHDARLPLWEAAYGEVKTRIIEQNDADRYPAGMAIRAMPA
jgi:hypothetical protein